MFYMLELPNIVQRKMLVKRALSFNLLSLNSPIYSWVIYDKSLNKKDKTNFTKGSKNCPQEASLQRSVKCCLKSNL